VKLTEQKKLIRENINSFLVGEWTAQPPAPSASDGALRSEAAEAAAAMTVVVVGAGPAGLMAARHVSKMGVKVVVLEARQRVGGRVHTDATALSAPVDLGASIITGGAPPSLASAHVASTGARRTMMASVRVPMRRPAGRPCGVGPHHRQPP
jgi:threonine dehydrogenase-like Zn-dependent dehydrogenase